MSVLNWRLRLQSALYIITENRPGQIPGIPPACQPCRKPSMSCLLYVLVFWVIGKNNVSRHSHQCGNALLLQGNITRTFFPPPSFHNHAKSVFTVPSPQRKKSHWSKANGLWRGSVPDYCSNPGCLVRELEEGNTFVWHISNPPLFSGK